MTACIKVPIKSLTQPPLTIDEQLFNLQHGQNRVIKLKWGFTLAQVPDFTRDTAILMEIKQAIR